jgi:hypothetical protein
MTAEQYKALRCDNTMELYGPDDYFNTGTGSAVAIPERYDVLDARLKKFNKVCALEVKADKMERDTYHYYAGREYGRRMQRVKAIRAEAAALRAELDVI